jgi:hypothetical protein
MAHIELLGLCMVINTYYVETLEGQELPKPSMEST